jgi:hypothetical protein
MSIPPNQARVIASPSSPTLNTHPRLASRIEPPSLLPPVVTPPLSPMLLINSVFPVLLVYLSPDLE